LAIFNSRRMSDCYSWTRHPCLATIADMLNIHKVLSAASTNGIRIYTLNDDGGLLWQTAQNWSWCSLLTPTVRNTVSWLRVTLKWMYSQSTASYFLVFLLPVLRTIMKCASWVIFLVAAWAWSQWTIWCLHWCCGPACAG
jgi:hypothetical protein